MYQMRYEMTRTFHSCAYSFVIIVIINTHSSRNFSNILRSVLFNLKKPLGEEYEVSKNAYVSRVSWSNYR